MSVLENYSIKSHVAALSVARCSNFDTLNSCVGLYLENIDLFDDVLSLVSGYMLLLDALLGNIDNLKLKSALRWENIGWPFDSCSCPQTKRDLQRRKRVVDVKGGRQLEGLVAFHSTTSQGAASV